MLAGDENSLENKPVYDERLLAKVKRAKKLADGEKPEGKEESYIFELRKKKIDFLNQAVEDFYLTHRNENLGREASLKGELEAINHFWTANSVRYYRILQELPNELRNMDSAVVMANKLEEYRYCKDDSEVEDYLKRKAHDVLKAYNFRGTDDYISFNLFDIYDMEHKSGSLETMEDDIEFALDQLNQLEIILKGVQSKIVTYMRYKEKRHVLVYPKNSALPHEEFYKSIVPSTKRRLLEEDKKLKEKYAEVLGMSVTEIENGECNAIRECVNEYHKILQENPLFKKMQEDILKSLSQLVTSQLKS